MAKNSTRLAFASPLRARHSAAALVFLLIFFAFGSAEAQMNLARFEGYWDPGQKRTDAVNWINLAAHGHAERKFAVTYIEGERVEGDAGGLWSPQFLPVTNVLGQAHEVDVLFAATPEQKITVVGMMEAGGQDLILNSAIVMSGKGKTKADTSK